MKWGDQGGSLSCKHFELCVALSCVLCALTAPSTYPLVLVADRYASLGEMMDETEELLRQRVLTSYDLAIMRPEDVSVLVNAYSAWNLLHTMQHICSGQLRFLNSWTMRKVRADCAGERLAVLA